jgi:hypothetical protein
MITIIVSVLVGMIFMLIILRFVEYNRSSDYSGDVVEDEQDVAAEEDTEEEQDACLCHCDLDYVDLLTYAATGINIPLKCVNCDTFIMMVNCIKREKKYQEELREMEKREYIAIQRGKHVLSSLGFAFFDEEEGQQNEI